MFKVGAAVAAGTWLVGILTPEVLEFLTAAMIPLNTALLIVLGWRSYSVKRRIDDDLSPTLNQAAEDASKTVSIVERRHLERADADGEHQH